MANRKTATLGDRSPLPVRLTVEDREALERAGARFGVGPSTMLRIAARLGLEALEDALASRKARAAAVVDRLAPIAPTE